MRGDVVKLLLAYNTSEVDAVVGVINHIINEGYPLDEFIEFAKEVSIARHRDNALALRLSKPGGKRGTMRGRHERLSRVIEPPPMPPLRRCKCGGLISGTILPSCESARTGRVAYAECDTCSYWMELVLEDGKYIERGNLIGG